jgi:hypothetical protein
MGGGQDGQFLKFTRDGKVIGAVGNGMGIGSGQFIEASYFVFDKHDNTYAGDTRRLSKDYELPHASTETMIYVAFLRLLPRRQCSFLTRS